jgi:hypothetical protein
MVDELKMNGIYRSRDNTKIIIIGQWGRFFLAMVEDSPEVYEPNGQNIGKVSNDVVSEWKVAAHYKASPATFIMTWINSKNLDEVASKLHMPKKIVTARASKYRQRGIALPTFKKT